MLTIMSIAEDGELRQLGESIRAMRKEQGLTQESLAMAAGVGRGVIQKLEEGRGTVNVASLIRIATALSREIRLIPRIS